ncbi:hypothetical protein [Frankia nepalensis]|uniref:hypothetical protein n=1 Tax=Frankia nepalensis TaxID=1836974 RepID=UPI001EE42364|nr:hypothetical protein [Frankia nepalensis]
MGFGVLRRSAGTARAVPRRGLLAPVRDSTDVISTGPGRSPTAGRSPVGGIFGPV